MIGDDSVMAQLDYIREKLRITFSALLQVLRNEPILLESGSADRGFRSALVSFVHEGRQRHILVTLHERAIITR
jgi:hypothetical protein